MFSLWPCSYVHKLLVRPHANGWVLQQTGDENLHTATKMLYIGRTHEHLVHIYLHAHWTNSGILTDSLHWHLHMIHIWSFSKYQMFQPQTKIFIHFIVNSLWLGSPFPHGVPFPTPSADIPLSFLPSSTSHPFLGCSSPILFLNFLSSPVINFLFSLPHPPVSSLPVHYLPPFLPSPPSTLLPATSPVAGRVITKSQLELDCKWLILFSALAYLHNQVWMNWFP